MHNVNHIHSCGYHCDKPGCIKEQRDDLVKKFIVNAINPLIESNLRKAAQALVDRWDTPLWKDVPHTGVFIDALRAALAEPEPCADEFDCDHMPWCRIRKTCQKQARAALAQTSKGEEMSELRKAAQMALEALNLASRNGTDGLKRYELKELDDTITALRAALAQPDEKFCDANCVWTDHHPDYALAKEPLTDQEIIEAIKHISHNEMSAFAIARAIESVLKNASSEANKGTYDNP